jgi:hypothetical protein
VVPAFQNANRIVPLVEGPMISLVEGRSRAQAVDPDAGGHLVGSDGGNHLGNDPGSLDRAGS